MNSKKLVRDFFLSPYFVFIFCIILYSRLIFSVSLPDVDHLLVVGPLMKVHSFSDYWNIFLTNKLYDIQPIRDLSLYIDILFERLTGHQFFGFFNTIFWLITVIFAEKTALLYINRTSARLMSLILLSHPILAWVISWPIARKHILSAMFITMATFYFKKLTDKPNTKNQIRCCLCYLLSIFSNPISILAIAPATIYMKVNGSIRKNFLFLVALGFVFIFGMSINFYYYDQLYPNFTQVEKMVTRNYQNVFIQFLALSRSLTQIVLPLQFSASYNPTSLLNFIGIPFLTLVIYTSSLKWGAKKTFIGFTFTIYPLALMITSPSNIFVSDTYLLITLVNLCILSFVHFRFLNNQLNYIFILAIIVFISKNLYELLQKVVDDQLGGCRLMS